MLRKTKADIGKSPHQLFVLVCVSEIVAAVYQIIICYFTAHEHSLPDYRKHGYAGQLIQCAIKDAREQGRKGLVLTCKEKLIKYYAKFGFVDEGVSDKSTHGNAVWHQMRLTF